MPITVDNALRRAMREHPGAVGIRIERAPLSQASAVLAQLPRELLSVAGDAPWGAVLDREGIPRLPYVSGVSRGPSAVGLWFDAKEAPPGLLDLVVGGM